MLVKAEPATTPVRILPAVAHSELPACTQGVIEVRDNAVAAITEIFIIFFIASLSLICLPLIWTRCIVFYSFTRY